MKKSWGFKLLSRDIDILSCQLIDGMYMILCNEMYMLLRK